jgi:hypothetical protein
MAENEILDIKGRRWRQTRRYLASADASALGVADSAAAECEAALRKDLNKYLREGTPLLLILKAAKEDPATLRRAIEAFKNKQIARIIQYAIQQCGPPYEANRIAQHASNRLLEMIIDKVGGYAATIPEYGARSRRAELDAALSKRLQELRSTVSTLLEHSLTGTRLRPAQPKPRTQREPIAVRTSTILGTSLLATRPVRHDPGKSH